MTSWGAFKATPHSGIKNHQTKEQGGPLWGVEVVIGWPYQWGSRPVPLKKSTSKPQRLFFLCILPPFFFFLHSSPPLVLPLHFLADFLSIILARTSLNSCLWIRCHARLTIPWLPGEERNPSWIKLLDAGSDKLILREKWWWGRIRERGGAPGDQRTLLWGWNPNVESCFLLSFILTSSLIWEFCLQFCVRIFLISVP